MEPDKLFSLLQALDEQRVDYVFGGMALNIHGLVRATEDVDLFVRPTGKILSGFAHPCGWFFLMTRR